MYIRSCLPSVFVCVCSHLPPAGSAGATAQSRPAHPGRRRRGPCCSWAGRSAAPGSQTHPGCTTPVLYPRETAWKNTAGRVEWGREARETHAAELSCNMKLSETVGLSSPSFPEGASFTRSHFWLVKLLLGTAGSTVSHKRVPNFIMRTLRLCSDKRDTTHQKPNCRFSSLGELSHHLLNWLMLWLMPIKSLFSI